MKVSDVTIMKYLEDQRQKATTPEEVRLIDTIEEAYFSDASDERDLMRKRRAK